MELFSGCFEPKVRELDLQNRSIYVRLNYLNRIGVDVDELKPVSVYYLLLELFSGGQFGLLPELEPISESSIIKELERQTGQTFHTDKKAWANWFLFEAEVGCELERENFLAFLATIKFQLS